MCCFDVTRNLKHVYVIAECLQLAHSAYITLINTILIYEKRLHLVTGSRSSNSFTSFAVTHAA